MDLNEAMEEIYEKYPDDAERLIGDAFSGDLFAPSFKLLVGIKREKAFVQAFDRFMAIAHETFRWNGDDHLEARMTAEKAFRLFYERQDYPVSNLETAVKSFITAFLSQFIDDNLAIWRFEHPDMQYPTPEEGDIDNLFLSRFFAVRPTDPQNVEFLESIGVEYDREQLKMCCIFSEQITFEVGDDLRDRANYSARITYNELEDPDSLIWIGCVMGVERDLLKKAAGARDTQMDAHAICDAIRKLIPFDRILGSYEGMLAEDK